MRKKINNNENIKLQIRLIKWTLCYMVVWFLAFSVMLILMDSSVWNSFVMNADTPLELLQGYARQTFWLEIMLISVFIILVGFAVIASVLQIKDWIHMNNKKIVKEHPEMGLSALIVVLVFAAFAILPIFMLKEEKVFEKYEIFVQDVAAIEEGRLEAAAVHFSTNYEETGLEAIGGLELCDDTVICYKGVGYKVVDNVVLEEQIESWTKFYVPNFLNFNLDMEHVYDECQYREWNNEHATMYRITYTPNLHLIVSIEVESIGK